MGWIRPISHNANESQWHNSANCYDGNLTTYGWDNVYGPPFSGYYIEFNTPEIQCNKIRFNARSVSGYVDKIDIDVYYNGSWHNVFYRGYFSNCVWVEVSLGGTYAVTKARVRFFNSSIFFVKEGWLYEFNFYEVVSEVGWVDEPYAYDNNTGTFAYCVTPAISWTPWLIRELPEAIYSSIVKFYAQYQGTSGINKIDLNVYYNGAWHDVFEGSYMNQVWIEKALGDTYFVSKIAVRFFNNSSNVSTAYIQEMQFVESAGVPKVTTNAATAVGDGKATLNGNITCTGGVNCTARGFKYKEGIGGEEQDTSDVGSFSTGTFSKDLSGLDPTKKYYFKAYATNTSGTGYGGWKSFGEDIAIPTVTTSAATSVDHEKAVLNGEITATGGEDPEERGFQYKIGEESTILTIRETGSFGIGTYSLDFDGLDPNVEYHFRAYAKNSAGTAYGSWLDFTTDYTTPMVKTHNATNELTTQVTGNGEIISTGGHDCDERGFEYGLSKVATWIKKETAGGYGVGFFSKTIDGLTANTEYWYRAFAKFILGGDDTKRTTSGVNKDRPQLQVVGDIIYITWQEMSGGKTQIYLGTMKTDGSGWTAVKLTSTAYNKTVPQFHIVEDKIYYVWQEDDGANTQIWTALSDLDGGNFVATKQTTSATNRCNPQLQVFGSKIYYVYEEVVSGYYALMLAETNLDGTNWSATQLHWLSLHSIFDPQLEVVGTKIYYVFARRASSTPAYDYLWTAYSDLDGSNFSLTLQDTNSNSIIEPPQLQVVGEKIYYIYTIYLTEDPYSQIRVASANLDGSGWSTSQKTSSPYAKKYPQLEVVEDKIHYVWHESDGSKFQIWTAMMNTNGSGWSATKKTTSAYDKQYPQLQVEDEAIYYVWQGSDGSYDQIWTSVDDYFIGYGEWLKFITAAPGLPGDRPSGYKNDVCSDHSGYTYILNRSFTDDGASYKSHFVLSTDLSGKKTLHTNKRLEDIFSYFANKGTGTAKVYIKRNNEPVWQEAGEISLAGEEEIIIKHLAPDFLAKTYLIKFVFWNDFEFIGAIFESIPIGDRP